MESIKEYLRLCCIVIQAPLSYVIRRTIMLQAYGHYPTYATPNDEIFTRMLHLPSEKNKSLSETNPQTIQVHMAEYEIDNRIIYDILDQICKDKDLYVSM